MMRLITSLLCAAALLMGGCSSGRHDKAVYLLLDTSGTYARELERANAIVNYLLATLGPGHSLAVARIDSSSFSEDDIIASVTFSGQPSEATDQKRAFRAVMTEFFNSIEPSRYTDIRGGMLQAAIWLKRTEAADQHILVFSDLQEDLPPGYKREFELPLKGIEVVALNVTKLRPDQVAPKRYLERLDRWRKRVVEAGGSFRVVNDLTRLEGLLRER